MMNKLEEIRNVIYLKNQLINGDIQKLKVLYSIEENYELFVNMLKNTLDIEPAFFLIDDSLLEKAEDILHTKRFECRKKDMYLIINDIIRRINYLKALPDGIKTLQKKQYLMWQEKTREVAFSGQSDFLNGMAYDAILMQKLQQKRLGKTDILYFFSSTNYLAKNLPEFYQEDKERITLTMEKLDEHSKKRGIWNLPERQFARETIKNIQKIKTKEE